MIVAFLHLSIQDLVQEFLETRMLRVIEDLFGCSVFEEFTAVSKDNAIGDLSGEAHFVGDNQHGHALFG